MSTWSGPPLPTGTLTFLFTDVEGSTRLWEEHPQPMRGAMARHDARLAQVFEQHDGVVVRPRGEGDSLFAVFIRATDAVAAALAGQQVLGAEDWGEVGPLRVRMGLHTGEADLREGDYYGSAVNRCARIRAAGHGGQVLVSEATARLVRGALPYGASLQSLGNHRLRDLAASERLFQLNAPDLATDFPPLKTLEQHPTNLPTVLSSFVGREHELEELVHLLGFVRLVTLTGPGGSGKTRLALQAAAELLDTFGDGVYFVDLAPVVEPGLVAATVARTLALPQMEGQSAEALLKNALREKRLLIVLDNFEHLIAAASLVPALLGACPDLALLVTSRECLRVTGEREYPVPPLPVDNVSGAAVELFLERAGNVRPDLPRTPANLAAIAAICARLDGLPLAIELAAARARLFTPVALLARLEQALPLLTTAVRDAPARQRSLRETISWSYALLSPAEQQLFSRLAVFAGGWTLEAADAVCGNEGALAGDVLESVTSLLEKNLLRRLEGPEDQPRFTMLETIREFARERLLAGGDLDAMQQRHAALFLALAESAETKLGAPERTAWERRLEREHDNLRAALAFSQHRADRHALFVQLAVALAGFWQGQMHWTEGRAWLDRAAAVAGDLPLPLRARALAGAGMLALEQRDFTVARDRFTKSLALRRTAGDRHGMAVSFHELGTLALHEADYTAAEASYEQSLTIHRELDDTTGIATLLSQLARVAEARRDHASARRLREQSLAAWQQVGDQPGIANARHFLGNTLIDLGEFDAARDALEENVAWGRASGDLHITGLSISGLGSLEYFQRNYAEARRLLTEALALMREAGDRRGLAEITHVLGWAMHGQGDVEAAIAAWEEMLGPCRQNGDLFGVALLLDNLGLAAQLRGEYEAARGLHEEALAVRRGIGKHRDIEKTLGLLAEVNAKLAAEARARGSSAEARRCLERRVGYLRELGDLRQALATLHELGRLAAGAADLAAARAYAEQSLALCRASGDQRATAAALANAGASAVDQGDYPAACELYGEALAIRRELGQPAGIAQALYDLGWLAQLEGDLSAAQRCFKESVAAYRRAADARGAAAALCNLAEVLLARQRPGPARAMYAGALSTFAACGDRRGIAACCEGLADLSVARRDFTQAARLLGAAQGLAEAKDAGRPGEPGGETASVVRAALGDAGFAAALEDGRSLSLQQLIAETVAQGDGAAPEPATVGEARAHGGEREGGSPAIHGRTILPAGLSAREAEVLRLIAAGKSNREIAAALVISLNTVLRHVTHILAKTGCANRADAARYAAEQHLI